MAPRKSAATDEPKIIVRGAREHNLKNINVEIPRDKLIVFTGLSGSGKSSLAFDTIYAEGQRRYVESLSAYARQFLGRWKSRMSMSSKGCLRQFRSTRRRPAETRARRSAPSQRYTTTCVCCARESVCQHCPDHGNRLERQTPQQIVDRVMDLPEGTRFQVLAPVVRGRKGEYSTLLEDLSAQGSCGPVDGETVDLDEFLNRDAKLARYEQHTIEIIVDRLVMREGIERRLTDSLESALKLADGVAELQLVIPRVRPIRSGRTPMRC